MLDRVKSLCKIMDVKYFHKIIPSPGIKTQEAAVRIRSSAKSALFCALAICAVQNNPSQTLETVSFCMPVNVIHVDIANIQEEPALFSSPISLELLPQSAQGVASNALWFSNFAFKSSSAVEIYDPAGCKQTNNVSASYVIASISSNTLSETLVRQFSCSV
jgi:hypothetical protein